MTPRLSKAIDFMKTAHRSIGQMRKDGNRPYEVHPLEVMERVSKVTDDEDILIAALLHDVIEDVFPTNPDFNEGGIGYQFGGRVLLMVQQLTDKFTKEAHPDKNRKTRKQLERERYATFWPEVKLIKLADIAANLSDDGGADAGFMGMYIREKAMCLPYLTDYDKANLVLFSEASKILQEKKRKFGVR